MVDHQPNTHGEVLFPDLDVPGWFTTTMLALNVLGTVVVAFTVVASSAGRSQRVTPRRAGRSG